jgi:predicted GNAT family acetyltransferase
MDNIHNDINYLWRIQAIEKNLHNFYKTLAKVSGVKLHEEKDIIWTTAEPHLIFWAQFEKQASDTRIQEVIKQMKEGKAPSTWLVGPLTKPADINRRLAREGFYLWQQWSGMAVNLAEAAEGLMLPPGLEVERVQTVKSMKDWIEVVNISMFSGSGVDEKLHWHMSKEQNVQYYLAKFDGVPVAASMMNLSPESAGIYMVSTLPSYRNRGFGTAVVSIPLMDARMAGHKLGVLEANKLGEGLYRRIGFKDYCQFYIFRKI